MSKIGAAEPVELGNIQVKASEEKPERGEDKPSQKHKFTKITGNPL